jgi:hypothetical protein
MSWIGYEEYQQHLAELAEVEQAAFRLEVAAGSRGSEQSPLPPAEPAPSVAISPNPSPLPLPAGEAGSTAPLPTTLVLEPAKEPSSTPPATSPTEPSVARGSDAEPTKWRSTSRNWRKRLSNRARLCPLAFSDSGNLDGFSGG